MQMALTGSITGAASQALTTPVLVTSYWLIGLPLGAWLAFGSSPKLGLLGIWLGMILAVFLHMAAYVCLCRLNKYPTRGAALSYKPILTAACMSATVLNMLWAIVCAVCDQLAQGSYRCPASSCS